MAKPKKVKPSPNSGEGALEANRLADLKTMARQMSNYLNAQYKQSVSYVPDKDKRAAVTVSKWLRMSETFQEAMELPGLPFGNITLVYGKPDTGKTTMLMEGIAACQAQGVLPILILSEHKFDFNRLPNFMGADPEAMIVLHAESLEMGYKFVEKILRDIKTGKIVLEMEGADDLVVDVTNQDCYIFWDSVGNTSADSELEYEVEDHNKSMGKAAKAIKTLTRRVNQLLGRVRQQAGILFLNQSYQSMPSYGPSIETPYGGDGIPYSAALIIRTRKVKELKNVVKGKEIAIGIETKLQMMKNHITHKRPIATVFTVATGMIEASEEALKQHKLDMKELEKNFNGQENA